jgi:hypothetical protein
MQPIALGPDEFIDMNPGTLAIFMNVNNRECDVYLFRLKHSKFNANLVLKTCTA